MIDKSYNSAFTLIEMSIVLVIIGLLAGGILVGGHLIESFQLSRIGAEHEEYNAAVNTFKLKFNCLPGDCDNATQFSLGTNGDGDGVVDYDSDRGNPPTNNPVEPSLFWIHLANAGLIEDGGYTATTTFNCHVNGSCWTAGTHAPNAPIGGSSSIVHFSYFSNEPGFFAAWSALVDTHVMNVGTTIGAYVGRWYNPYLTTLQQWQLDQKFDDGLPFQGDIVDIMGGGAWDTTTNCETTDVPSTAEYDLSYTDAACAIMWKAGF